jgi:thymidylate synthase (FAD)
MKVDLLDREMVDSDLGVVNAARCSFDKESSALTEKDIKLISYLAKHDHWTPFAHSQVVFDIRMPVREAFFFFYRANLSGFEWVSSNNLGDFTQLRIRGSLYAWLTNCIYLPTDISEDIQGYLYAKYPISCQAIKGKFEERTTTSRATSVLDNDDLGIYDALQTHTFRIHCPIFVKRQLETHRRNLVLTDIADLSQNEVSRRYVDNEPEIWAPSRWRVQSKDKKQGSDDQYALPLEHALLTDSNYNHTCHMAKIFYQTMNNKGIAYEQSRAILPLSTYTTFWWTGSMKSWKRVIDLRTKDDAQGETREVVTMIKELLSCSSNE